MRALVQTVEWHTERIEWTAMTRVVYRAVGARIAHARARHIVAMAPIGTLNVTVNGRARQIAGIAVARGRHGAIDARRVGHWAAVVAIERAIDHGAREEITLLEPLLDAPARYREVNNTASGCHVTHVQLAARFVVTRRAIGDARMTVAPMRCRIAHAAPGTYHVTIGRHAEWIGLRIAIAVVCRLIGAMQRRGLTVRIVECAIDEAARIEAALRQCTGYIGACHGHGNKEIGECIPLAHSHVAQGGIVARIRGVGAHIGRHVAVGIVEHAIEKRARVKGSASGQHGGNVGTRHHMREVVIVIIGQTERRVAERRIVARVGRTRIAVARVRHGVAVAVVGTLFRTIAARARFRVVAVAALGGRHGAVETSDWEGRAVGRVKDVVDGRARQHVAVRQVRRERRTGNNEATRAHMGTTKVAHGNRARTVLRLIRTGRAQTHARIAIARPIVGTLVRTIKEHARCVIGRAVARVPGRAVGRRRRVALA